MCGLICTIGRGSFGCINFRLMNWLMQGSSECRLDAALLMDLYECMRHEEALIYQNFY